MASILDQYGIKEVADVTIYDLETGEPVLFLDTLKISTIEQTAEQAEARGGKGNPPLIIWDYGKEITVTLQDALFSPASMAVMYGDKDGASSVTQITKMRRVVLSASVTSIPTGITYYKVGDPSKPMAVATTADLVAGATVYEESTIAVKEGSTKIEITAENFPGTYKLVGETYARNRKTGKDEYFQFIIPQAKMSAENTITLEAEGDPSVFDMTMRVLRPESGAMMELIQYDVPDADSFSTFSAQTASHKSSSLS